MGGTVRLALLLFACFHVIVRAAPLHSGQSGERHASQTIDKAELPREPRAPISTPTWSGRSLTRDRLRLRSGCLWTSCLLNSGSTSLPPP